MLRRGGRASVGLDNYIFMLLAFCAMQPIEKQINPLASMPIDSIFSFGVPLICRCPAMSKADSEATNGRAAQLQFMGDTCGSVFFLYVDRETCC